MSFYAETFKKLQPDFDPRHRDFFCHSCGASTPNGLGCCRACALDYEFEAREEREQEGLGRRRPQD